ncbi:MAG: hypothetical protein ACFFD4_07085 [Candidatus Odinarchaeota archaeon]
MDRNKIRVEIFVPDGACSCTFSQWIDRVYRIVLNYKEHVEYESFTTASERARELGINSMCVTVNEKTVNVRELDKTIRKSLASSS